jgi:hypothetical protein
LQEIGGRAWVSAFPAMFHFYGNFNMDRNHETARPLSMKMVGGTNRCFFILELQGRISSVPLIGQGEHDVDAFH